jgi:hypothetical protein
VLGQSGVAERRHYLVKFQFKSRRLSSSSTSHKFQIGGAERRQDKGKSPAEGRAFNVQDSEKEKDVEQTFERSRVAAVGKAYAVSQLEQ